MDYAACVSRIENAGLRWIRPGSVYRHTTDCFLVSEIATLECEAQANGPTSTGISFSQCRIAHTRCLKPDDACLNLLSLRI